MDGRHLRPRPDRVTGFRARAARTARRLLRRAGIEAIRYSPRNFAHLRRADLLRGGRLTLVLDVGASTGRWSEQVRRAGFAGRIVSFEPLSRSFAELEARARADSAWECLRVALGDEEAEAELHVAANAASSSLLPMDERHLRAAPQSRYVGAETVRVRRLDALREELVREDDRALLKLDVQGTELAVLRGAAQTLREVEAVEAELSVVELYEGQALLPAVLSHLDEAGFRLVALEPTFRDPRTGDLLQLNGLFLRGDG